jgi:MFS family permease
MPRLHFQTYSNWSTALPALCFGCYTSMAIALLTFLPQLAYNDRVWLAVVLPLMSMGGNFCAGWLAQLWLSPLRLYRLAQAGVGIAALSLWLLSTIGLSIAPVALALMFMLGLVGGAAYALIPYLSDAALVQVRANGALAQMGNLGATLGPPLFAALVAALGPLGLVLFYFHFDKTSIIQGQLVIDLITSGVFSIANKPIVKSSSSACIEEKTLL